MWNRFIKTGPTYPSHALRRALLFSIVVLWPGLTLSLIVAFFLLIGMPSSASTSAADVVTSVRTMLWGGLIAIPYTSPITLMTFWWSLYLVRRTHRRASRSHPPRWDVWVRTHAFWGGAWQGILTGIPPLLIMTPFVDPFLEGGSLLDFTPILLLVLALIVGTCRHLYEEHERA